MARPRIRTTLPVFGPPLFFLWKPKKCFERLFYKKKSLETWISYLEILWKMPNFDISDLIISFHRRFHAVPRTFTRFLADEIDLGRPPDRHPGRTRLWQISFRGRRPPKDLPANQGHPRQLPRRRWSGNQLWQPNSALAVRPPILIGQSCHKNTGITLSRNIILS